MAGELQPLDLQFPIVDAQGRPTQYFIRWAQQRQIDIGDSITLTDLQAFLTAHKLVAGNGIGLAPDGDLNNSPTITAKVQEILDQISAVRGTVLYRGAAGWAGLAPGAAGLFLQTAGAGADPAWAAAGGAGGGMGPNGFLNASPPDPASFTLVGANPAGTTTAYLAGSYFNITLPALGTSAKYTKGPLPAAPYNIYCAVSLSGDPTTGTDISVSLFDAANAFVRKIRQTMVGGTYRWGISSGAGDIKTLAGAQTFGTTPALFMRIQNDGVNVKYYFSMDYGLTWLLFLTEAVATIATATKWGFQCSNSSTTLTFGCTFWALYLV